MAFVGFLMHIKLLYIWSYHISYVKGYECFEACCNVVDMCHRYLAHMYMAECLVALDCIADGIDHLNPDVITDISTVFPTEQKSEQG